ncbi:MAG: class I SAM-dependent methyltransferase [Fluviicola sp.]
MKQIRELSNVDIYVIDQLLKGNIHADQRILDAGCGSGRNFSYFAKHNFDITGLDPNKEHISSLRKEFPSYKNRLHHSSIEDFHTPETYDFIICNAVLHFAENHQHFEQLFSKLIQLLDVNGTLFIRMTTDHGLTENYTSDNGVFILPDGSTRYLIRRSQVNTLCEEHNLDFVEPFKTVLVEEYRSMSSIVLKKNSPVV